jgi:hypothetical protein
MHVQNMNHTHLSLYLYFRSFLETNEQLPEPAPPSEDDESDGLGDTHDKLIGNLSMRSCCKCLDVFSDYAELDAHFEEMHPDDGRANIPILPYDSKKKQCTLCRAIVNSVRAHRRRKHYKDYQRRMIERESKKFKCHKCDMLISSRSKLLVHMKLHLKELASSKTIISACQICEFKTKSLCLLDKHLLDAHPDDKSIKCEVCGKMMKLATSLKKHMRIHFNSREFCCEFCDKAFLYKCGKIFEVW